MYSVFLRTCDSDVVLGYFSKNLFKMNIKLKNVYHPIFFLLIMLLVIKADFTKSQDVKM